MADEDIGKYVTIKNAARMLGVSTLTLRNWDKKSKLCAYRHPINNYRIYKLEDIQSFLGKFETRDKPRKINIEVLEDDTGQKDIEDVFEI